MLVSVSVSYVRFHFFRSCLSAMQTQFYFRDFSQVDMVVIDVIRSGNRWDERKRDEIPVTQELLGSFLFQGRISSLFQIVKYVNTLVVWYHFVIVEDGNPKELSTNLGWFWMEGFLLSVTETIATLWIWRQKISKDFLHSLLNFFLFLFSFPTISFSLFLSSFLNFFLFTFHVLLSPFLFFFLLFWISFFFSFHFLLSPFLFFFLLFRISFFFVDFF